MNASTSWQWTEARPVQRLALAVGGAGLGACALGATWDPDQFFHSYLLAFMTWLALGLGSLPLIMLHHLTGGRWGLVIQRMLEAASRTLPLMLVLGVPLVFGLARNYEWARADQEHENRAHEVYLSVSFFLGRAAIYFAVWLTAMFLLNSWSAAHDRTGDPGPVRRAQQFSGPGLVLYGLTVTFAAVDWVMSLDAHWSSTIFGVVVAIGQMLPALALAVTAATFLPVKKVSGSFLEPENGPDTFLLPAVWNDLGNLLLAFVMLWTYIAFSQFLIIWSGNLPEEITWYLARSEGGWIWIAVVLAVFNFAVPFVLLLSRDVKRDPRRLRLVALAIVAMGIVYQFWLIAPAFSPGRLWLDWMDVAAVLGMGGLWLAVFLWQVQMQPPLPLHPGDLGEEALRHA
jgi:hypothetical protein